MTDTRRKTDDLGSAHFASALAECEVGVAILRPPDFVPTFVNPAHTRLCGWQTGPGWPQNQPHQPNPAVPDITRAVLDAAAAVIETGRPVRLAELPAGERFLHIVCSPIRSTPEPGVSVVTVDITDQVQARRRAEARHQRLAVLDEATSAVTAELDPRREFIALAESVVPALADACAVYLVDHPQPLDPSATSRLQATRLVCVIDPVLGIAPPAPEIRLRLAPTRPTAQAARTGEIILAHGPQADPSGWGEHWLTLLDPHSLVAIPIGSPDAVLAVVKFAAVGKRQRYEDSDIALMREITTRVDVAVGHALRLQRTSEVALTLQRGLLSEPPEVDGVEIRGCYRPAGPGLEVGGDWYDAFLHPDGDLILTVGDVVGHDLYAASTMGQLRSMVQALACQPGAEPGAVMTSLNRLSRHLQIGEMSTVVHGRLTPARGDQPARFTWANAGHPPPLLVGPGDSATVLDGVPSPLIGLADIEYEEASVEVPTGAALVLYTDGLMEDPERPEVDTIVELAESAGKLTNVDLGELCDRLIAGAPIRDDIALLAVRVAR